MKLLISLENCNLEIAHIGTRLQIAIQETQEAAHNLVDALIALGKAISDAFLCAWKCVNDLIRPAVRYLPMPPTKKDDSKKIDRIASRAEAAQRLAKRGKWV